MAFGGFPLGLRGDGLFAGFGPGDPKVGTVMALSACAFALDAVERDVNPRLDRAGIARVQARAGLDYGRITFVRSGSRDHSEINPLGFAAKCEKKADSWEIVIGQGLAEELPDATTFVEHAYSPKTYQRDYQRRNYRFYDYQWRMSPAMFTLSPKRSSAGIPYSSIHFRPAAISRPQPQRHNCPTGAWTGALVFTALSNLSASVWNCLFESCPIRGTTRGPAIPGEPLSVG